MSRMMHLCLGACVTLLLVSAVFWMPSNVVAAPGGPENGSGGKNCPTIHNIALGENLTLIAANYGVSLEALIEENGIEDPDLIVENQALCIPGKSRGGALVEWSTNGVPPGQSYDPNYVSKPGGYGPQENGYGPQENGYSNPGVKPGASYDPSLYSYGDQKYSYDAPGKAGDSYTPEPYWKDVHQYPKPLGGRIFPEYVPSSEEEDPDPTPTPDDTPDDNDDQNGVIIP